MSGRALARFSLRGRLMIIGVTGLSVALIVGGLAFYGALTLLGNRSLDSSALASAKDVAALVNTDRLSTVIPSSGAQVVQVVDSSSRVLAGSATADRITPLLTYQELRAAIGGAPVVIDGVRLGLSEPLRVRAVSAGRAEDPVSVIAALPYGEVLATRRVLRNALLITFPLLVAGLAAIAWRVIGVTLRPVEVLRAGAEQISRTGPEVDRQLDPERTERLPVPQAADEIRALAVTLNTMLDRLAEARERQRAFVADAAHELRSPLASMQTQLEVAEHLGEGGELPGELLVDLRRLGAMVEDLLLLARSDADLPAASRPVWVDVRPVLADLADRSDRSAVSVTLAAGEALMIRVDPDEFRRVIANLVGNAVRYAVTKVELAGRIEPTDDHDQHMADHEVAVITVSDDGPGIAAADRVRVFQRFTRLDGARSRDSGGSGLGLAIVRELVTRAGGSVAFVDGAPPFTLAAEIRLPAGSPPA